MSKNALNQGKTQLDEDDQGIWLIINNLSVLLQDLGRFSEAEPLLREALEKSCEAGVGLLLGWWLSFLKRAAKPFSAR